MVNADGAVASRGRKASGPMKLMEVQHANMTTVDSAVATEREKNTQQVSGQENTLQKAVLTCSLETAALQENIRGRRTPP